MIFTPLVLGLTALSVNELTRRLRSRVQAVQTAAPRAGDSAGRGAGQATASAAASTLLRESADLLRSVHRRGHRAVHHRAPIRSGRIDVFNAGAQKMLGVAAHDVIGRPNITASICPRSWRHDATPVDLSRRPLVPASGRRRPGRGLDLRRPTAATLRVQVAVTARHDAAGDIEGFLFVATDVTARPRAGPDEGRVRQPDLARVAHPAQFDPGLHRTDRRRRRAPAVRRATSVSGAPSNATPSDCCGWYPTCCSPPRWSPAGSRCRSRTSTCTPWSGPRSRRPRPAPTAGTSGWCCPQPDRPLVVCGDPVRLGQAVDNLISNAVKFTPPRAGWRSG